jgi:hypothetical protein
MRTRPIADFDVITGPPAPPMGPAALKPPLRNQADPLPAAPRLPRQSGGADDDAAT